MFVFTSKYDSRAFILTFFNIFTTRRYWKKVLLLSIYFVLPAAPDGGFFGRYLLRFTTNYLLLEFFDRWSRALMTITIVLIRFRQGKQEFFWQIINAITNLAFVNSCCRQGYRLVEHCVKTFLLKDEMLWYKVRCDGELHWIYDTLSLLFSSFYRVW